MNRFPKGEIVMLIGWPLGQLIMPVLILETSATHALVCKPGDATWEAWIIWERLIAL